MAESQTKRKKVCFIQFNGGEKIQAVYVRVYLCVCIFACVCVCVCVKEGSWRGGNVLTFPEELEGRLFTG